MRISNLRPLLAVAAASCALLGLSASSALASGFTPSNAGMKWSGSLSLTHSGVTKTCTVNWVTSGDAFPGYVSGTSFEVWGNLASGNCTGATTYKDFRPGEATVSGGVWTLHTTEGNQFLTDSPWGPFIQADMTLGWTNGAGAVKSKVTFSNDLIGSNSTYATGVLNATTLAGNLITLT